MPEPSEDALQSLALLAWVPMDAAKRYLEKAKDKMEKAFAEDLERDKWSQHALYSMSKAELEAKCKQEELATDGSVKYKLVKKLAQKSGQEVQDLPEYRGDLHAVPSTMSGLMKVKISYLKQILKYHAIMYAGTKHELAMRVYFLKKKQSFMIFESERVLLTEAVYLFSHRRT